MKNKILKPILYLCAVGAGVLFLTFLSSSLLIGFEVSDRCSDAQDKYEGDCVEVLMQTLDDEENSFRERNQAIWALGQLGDERALPVLEKYYTGDMPDRENPREAISQYELKKAIKWVSGGFNITLFIWQSKI